MAAISPNCQRGKKTWKHAIEIIPGGRKTAVETKSRNVENVVGISGFHADASLIRIYG
jgi:hypothetical protein